MEAIAAQRMALLASFPPGTFSKPNFDELVPFDQYQALNDISSWVALASASSAQSSCCLIFIPTESASPVANGRMYALASEGRLSHPVR